MAQPTARIRQHHSELMGKFHQLVETVEALQTGDVTQRREELQGFVTFFLEELLPHAESEEHALYPAADDLICQHGRPTATMSLDHEAIVERIDDFKECIRRVLADETPQARDIALACLKRVIHYLDALLSVHFRKEEEALLALMDEHLSHEEAQEVIHRMHGHGEHHEHHEHHTNIFPL
ncbi:TPA: hypothetical protein EYP66_14995 [Candidatus Poribacteria bacterium]|nr:hypothetical protein [Candidatus Poribacteria bacterium]